MASMVNSTKCLVACPIFKDELEIVLPCDVGLNIHFMDYRIHNDGRRMLQELNKAVLSAGRDDIALLVGRECYCDISIADFAKGIAAGVPLEKNCIEAILGPEKTDALQRNRTTVHTRGWMRMIRRFIAQDGLNGDSIRMMLGYFDRIVLLDYGLQPYSDEDILSYYDLLQVPVEVEPVRLHHFEGVLKRLLEWSS